MMNRKQSGMTMLGFLITLSVIMFFLYVGMKVVPMYIEFYSVKKAIASIAQSPSSPVKCSIAATTPTRKISHCFAGRAFFSSGKANGVSPRNCSNNQSAVRR